ncbi:MAG: TetR/AcrR family transcriptional regulator [Chloroflexota bacterium]|nr:TetR/AcrR family transcriptional regulator [Chloroflexota bacterium]
MSNLNSHSVVGALPAVQRLMDGAHAVFVERGYHAANVHEICARAQVGIGTFYANFDHKRQLLQRLMVERAVTIPASLEPGDLAMPERLAERLRRSLDDPLSAGLWLAWHQAVLEEEDLARFQAQWRPATIGQLAALIEAARQAHPSRRDLIDAPTVAWMTVTLSRELVLNDRQHAPDVDGLARLVHRLVFG